MPDAGGGSSLPSVPGCIPGVAEEALLLAEAAEGAKQSHKGEQHSGTCSLDFPLGAALLTIPPPVLSDTCKMLGNACLGQDFLVTRS